MTFTSTGLTYEEVSADFDAYRARRAVNSGLAPASAVNAQGFDLRSWMDKLKPVQGGAATDRVEDGVDQTYRSRRNDLLKREEGFWATAYADPSGTNKSIGYGFNLDRKDARDVLSRAAPGASFEDIYNGKRALTKEEAERLLDIAAGHAEQHVANRFKGVNLTEHQRAALVSMAYNGPSLITQRLVGAVANGDPETAVHEFLNSKSVDRFPFLAPRRWREAQIFLGPASNSKLLPDFKAYRASKKFS